MDIHEKLEVLADSAKYDVSCASSGSNRKNVRGTIGSTSSAGICHTFTQDGRCISLFKILMTNICMYDCVYCINRVSNDIKRAYLSPEEIINLTLNFYTRNYIEGLFLSSGVIKSPNYTMELLIYTIKTLRIKYKFNGYIHIKIIPGSNNLLVKEAGLFADRVSVNMELPSNKSLALLAPQKSLTSISSSMVTVHKNIEEYDENSKLFKYSPSFSPAGQSTQVIVGASNDNDEKILSLSENLYNKYKLKRVYYSAYIPVLSHKLLPAKVTSPPLLREHRLYQADWLLRFYGFNSSEIFNGSDGNLNLEYDPKTNWALNNIHLFPIEINTAPKEILLRIPGIGMESVKKILTARRVASLSFEDLKTFKVVLKRAKYFITCKGKIYPNVILRKDFIENSMKLNNNFNQLSMFSENNNIISIS